MQNRVVRLVLIVALFGAMLFVAAWLYRPRLVPSSVCVPQGNGRTVCHTNR